MADKFQNKYRIPSARLQTWNYGLAAAYFVTVCTDSHRHFFGKIAGGEMFLSPIGEIVKQEWIKTPALRPDMNLELDAFCVMPNHFHVIIIIGSNDYNNRTGAMHRIPLNKTDDISKNNDPNRRDAMHRVSTTHDDEKRRLLTPTPPTGNKFGAQSKNLASIMRGFKSAVTIAARLIDKNFKWQTRFHDHIIRNNLEFQRIRKYIIENPQNWQKDKFFSDSPDIK